VTDVPAVAVDGDGKSVAVAQMAWAVSLTFSPGAAAHPRRASTADNTRQGPP
jgi:hypothetical protein